MKPEKSVWKIDPAILVVALSCAFGYGILTNRTSNNEIQTAQAVTAIQALVATMQAERDQRITTMQAERDQRAALQGTVNKVEAQMAEREKRFDLDEVHARMRRSESDMRAASRVK